MERELKIADLARLWHISVTATWSRIRKEGLTTSKKMDNNKEITFVIIPEEVLNKYQVIEVVNNDNKVNNQVDCKELLSNNNDNKVDNQLITTAMIEFAGAVNEKLIEINNNYNEQLTSHVNKHIEDVNKQVEKVVQKEQEIAELKAENKILKGIEAQKKRYQLCIIALSVTFFIIVITLVYFLVKAQNKPPKIITTEKVVEKVVNVPVKVKRR